MYTIVCLIWIFFYKKRLIISAFSFPLLISFGGVIWPLIKGQKQEIWECHEYSSGGRLGADCSKQRRNIGVPTNLNPKLEILNLSGNKLSHITDKSFERYKDYLIVLDLSNCLTQYRKFDPGAFSLFTKLLYLNMSATCLPDQKQIPYLELPKTVIVLEYEFCETYRTINLSSMDALEELYARDCRFTTFPIFSTSNPVIRYADLQSNGLEDLRPIDMAPYCLLKQLSFRMKSSQGLLNEDKYCECMRVKKWLDYTEIKYRNLDCTEPGRIPADCNSDQLDPEAVRLREECLNPPKTSDEEEAPFKRWLIIIFIIFAILVLLVSVAVVLFVMKKFKKTDVTESEEVEKENDEDNEQESISEEEPQGNETAEEEESGGGLSE